MNKFFIISGGLALVFSLAGCQNAEVPAIQEQPKTSSAPPATSSQTSSSEAAVTQQEQTDQVAATVELKATQEPLKTPEIKQKTTVTTPVSKTKITSEKAKTTAPSEALKGITIKADGFAPSNITIAPGTKVIFINMDDNLHWPASGIHPTHQICPGFDALKGLAKNETYTFTFTEAKTCPFHDHLNPALQGKIIVK